MSKSNKAGKHFMDDNFRLYKSIRKKQPPATKVMKSSKRQKKWDWREELEGEDNES